MWEKFWTRAKVVPFRYILVALGICAGLLWLRFAPPAAPWSPRSVAGYVLPEPRVITKVVKEVVPGPERIRIVPKKVIVEKWRDLPTSPTLANDNAVVTAVATIPASPDGGTAIAVLTPNQAGEGVGTIEYRPAEPKFWQMKKEFGIRAGMGTGGLVLGEIYVHPLRMGPVNVEGRGFVQRDNARGADFGAAVLVDYRF